MWDSGLPTTGYPNVVASTTEGHVTPAPGYVWTDESIYDVGPAPPDDSGTQTASNDNNTAGRMVVDLGIALLAGAAAEPQESDMPTDTYLGHPIAQAVQEGALSDFKNAASGN